jgi:hypothetical protein
MLKLCFPEKSFLLEGRVRLRVSTDEQNLDLHCIRLALRRLLMKG